MFKRIAHLVNFLKRAKNDKILFTASKEQYSTSKNDHPSQKLSCLDDILNEINEAEFALLEKKQFTLRLAVKNYNAYALYNTLTNILPEASYTLNSKLVSTEEVRNLPLNFGSEKLKIVSILSGRPLTIFIETYFLQTLSEKWQCNTKNNPYMRIASDSFWASPEQTRSMLHSRSDLSTKIGSVDVVYTWANIFDAEWLEAKNTLQEDVEEYSNDSQSDSRFNYNQEIVHSINSIHINMPWIRHIYILSTGEAPDFFKAFNSSKIKWVKHEEVIEAKYLPTFNSHVIESHLHKIEGLSDYFIYMNDDVMINKPLEYDYFLDFNGTTKPKMEKYGMVNGTVDLSSPDYLNASRNSAEILFEDYGYYPTQLHEHCPQIFCKAVLIEIEEKYRTRVNEFRANKFRALNDLNITSFFYHHYAYVTQRANYVYGAKNKLIKNTSKAWKEDCSSLLQAKDQFDTICFNEGDADSKEWQLYVPSVLKRLYPPISS